MPINFRNMPVGSTNTILYLMYRENGVVIPKDIAGLMLSGIISDTLLLKSPTTTEIDRTALNELSRIAEVDPEKYGMEMFKAGSSLKGKTKEEILYTDFKNFEVNYQKIGVGQVYTMDIQEFLSEKDSYVQLINKVAVQNDYSIVALFVTDIIKNGSYVFFNDNSKETLATAFDFSDLDQGFYLDGVVSRKKQMIPNIMRVLDSK